jgi:tripartite-type tricarboxylate transporter receptor subunit TctC
LRAKRKPYRHTRHDRARAVGVVVPAGTPEPIVERISRALETALATADVRERLDIAGCEPKSAPLKQLWAKVVKDVGITAD